MSTLHILVIAIWSSIFLPACGSSDSNNDSSTTESIASIGDIEGSWVLDSVAFRDNSSQAITLSGINKLRVRPNGTFLIDSRGVTLSGGGQILIDSCTAITSGKIELAGQKVLYSDRVQVVFSGDCTGEESSLNPPPRADSIPDTSANISRIDDKLLISFEFTYLDNQGNSKKDTIEYNYLHASDETWDGDGLDSDFIGTWGLDKVYLNWVCDYNSSYHKVSELAVAGQYQIAFQADQYAESFINFAVGSADKCTANTTGSISASKFGFTMSQISASSPCAAEEEDGDTVTERRNIVVGDRYINFSTRAVTNSSAGLCVGSGSTTVTWINVLEKK